MIVILRKIYFFFDDSGVFHRNEPSGFFVYAGFVFTSRGELDAAKRKYICANKELKKALGVNYELKAAVLKNKHKRALFNSVSEYESLSACVELNRIYDYIIDNKKSRCRYKDYVLKLCVKRKLEDLIQTGAVKKDDDVHLFIYIDEQLTATDGYYDLRDSIQEELQHGIVNFNYGVVHEKVFTGQVTVSIPYCESKNNYLIQASDILANRIWTSYRLGKPGLRKISGHMALTFP